MRSVGSGTKAWLLSSVLLVGCTFVASNAEAAQHRHGSAKTGAVRSLHANAMNAHSGGAHFIGTHMTLGSGARTSHAMHMRMGGRRFAVRSYGISCVPYARQASGIEVAGNAWQWWDNAQGMYARGDAPEAGSVLNFRANGRMRLGHVAVVTSVVNPREVTVEHANWPGGGGRGGVSHDVTVVDVSEANNWSAVRVELGRGGEFGSIYPTYGFIYNRPDNGRTIASIAAPAPQVLLNPEPADLRPAAERSWHAVEEVAEAPVARHHHSSRRIDLTVPSASLRFGR